MIKSSKSRKKQNASETLSDANREDVAAEPCDAVVSEVSEETDTRRSGEEEAAVTGSDVLPDDQHVLPEAVTDEALLSEVPEGEVPRLTNVIEAILFASQKAVTPKELVIHLKNAAAAEPTGVASAFVRIREANVQEALEELRSEVLASGRAYQVRETATGWLLCSGPGFAPWLRALYPEAKPTRLSAPALETLAIIAYRQPIARADIEAVRGVAVDGVMQTLLDRGLIRIAGRAEVAGRPLLYATTQYFLDHFALRNLDELPNAAELRHIILPKAHSQPEGDGSSRLEGTPELPGVLDAAPDTVEDVPDAAIGEAVSGELESVTALEGITMEVRESVVFEELEVLEEHGEGMPRETPHAESSES
jgi:segregation and condensation protein B